ncbi:50S ribosomal protein L19e [Candidatus Woesearchaeota archaeon]|nr:50S ribosomal protein L19e [Candidatus Woesearchaeota archaeon]
MKLNLQKRLAAQILKCSEKKIQFDVTRLSDIKEAITKADIKSLIFEKVIKKKPTKNTSKYRARKKAIQKRKGRQRGHGSRKGSKSARLPTKRVWINKIRLQRKFLKELKDKKIITPSIYQQLYMKAKGGFFRNKKHVKLYLEEHHLAKKK